MVLIVLEGQFGERGALGSECGVGNQFNWLVSAIRKVGWCRYGKAGKVLRLSERSFGVWQGSVSLRI